MKDWKPPFERAAEVRRAQKSKAKTDSKGSYLAIKDVQKDFELQARSEVAHRINKMVKTSKKTREDSFTNNKVAYI